MYLKEDVKCSVLAVLSLRCFLDIPLEMSVRQPDKWSLEILGGVLAEDMELEVICI